MSQIETERLDRGVLYTGGIFTGNANVVRFVAVGDTDEIVQDTRARFWTCMSAYLLGTNV